MIAHRNLPPGGLAILDARLGGFRPSSAVVSFVGSTRFDAPHVFPEPGKRYDWRFLARMPVYIVADSTCDMGDTLPAIFRVSDPTRVAYPTFIDPVALSIAYVIDADPIRFWTQPKGGAIWQEAFPCN